MDSDRSAREPLIEEVAKTVRRAGGLVDIISYPSANRSVDLVVSAGEEKIFLKVTHDLKSISRTEAEDLLKAEKAYSVATAVIATKNYEKELEDDVVYYKQNIKALTPKTLEKYLRGEKPIVASIKGNYVLKINSDRFSKKRLEHGYSRGELARLLGVTSKAIYMYERGEMFISLEKALTLAPLLGEDIFEELSLSKLETASMIKPCIPRDGLERLIYSLAASLEREFLNFNKIPIDAVVKTAQPISIVKKTSNDVKEKLENAEKIANRVRTEIVVVEGPRDLERLRKLIVRASSQQY